MVEVVIFQHYRVSVVFIRLVHSHSSSQFILSDFRNDCLLPPPPSFTTMWLALDDADLHFSLILILLNADTHASNDHCEENIECTVT